jgi:hypothetical protein
MNAKQFLAWCGIILAVCFVFVGCGKKGGQAGAGNFDSAPPEIKALWDHAFVADKANDYVNAATNYNQLVALESKLTPKQFDAVVTASRTFTQRMVDAANGGDDSAKKALAQLMRAQNHR